MGRHRSGAKVWGHRSVAKRWENVFGRARPLFGSKSTISRFGDRFRYGQYSLVSFLFAVLLLSVPARAQPFVKVGHVPPCPIYGVGATNNGGPNLAEIWSVDLRGPG